MQTEHVKYDLMDYVTNQLNAEKRKRVEQHLKICSICNNHYNELSSTDSFLKQHHDALPTSVYYSTILPRVRERILARKRSIWDFGYGITRIVLPLAVSVLFVLVLIRIPKDSFSESSQTEALHQAVFNLNDDEVVQAIEKEYTGSSLLQNQEVDAAGVEEHLQGDRFLKMAISKQIESEEVSDIEVESIISDLDRDQVDHVLAGLSERHIL